MQTPAYPICDIFVMTGWIQYNYYIIYVIFF
jgi:hypothetical protein